MADDLLCCERLQWELPTAERDPAIFDDLRTLQNLLNLEKHYVPCNYFDTIQQEIKPSSRHIACHWMYDVCSALPTEAQVYPLSVNLMDRFLSKGDVPKKHLQLLAAVCMLLASKVRQCVIISVPKLCYFADESFSPEDVQHWEVMVLQKLSWDLMAVTAHDFIHLIIDRFNLVSEDNQLAELAVDIANNSYREFALMTVLPSILATACITAAARGLNTDSSATVLDSVCEVLGGATPAEIESIVILVGEAYARGTNPSPPQVTPDKHDTMDQQPNTPTDVSDIRF